jgi:hypothetical protein
MHFTFLMCSERSGSNLITKIMDSHSEYCGPSPTHLFRILLGNNFKYGSFQDDQNWEIFLKDVIDLYNSKLGVWRSQINIDRLKSNISDRSITAALKFIYHNEAKLNGKSKLFVKENKIYDFIYFLLTDFEYPKFLHFVRDPRDMALSWKLSPNLRGCIMRAGNTWKRDQKEYLKIFSCLQRQNRAILMRYEDLLTDSGQNLKKLCKFLNIEFEDKLLEFRDSDLTMKNADSSADWKNLNKPLMRANFNKYQNGLTDEEIKYVECLCHEEMDILGYKREYDCYSDLEKYASAIEKFELMEKPAYLKLSERERNIRSQRYNIEKSIAQKASKKIVQQIAL